MTRHPEIGARILEHAGLRDIAAWVLAHHERLDGRGYPGGLAADEIPLEARILAVADAYEAMIADRPYRRGMPAEEARAELERCAGTQFDPTVVEAFLGTLRAPRPRPRLGATRLATRAASIARQRRSTSSAVVRVWPIATRTKRVSPTLDGVTNRLGSALIARASSSVASLPSRVAEADERERDGRDALEPRVRVDAAAELLRERDVLAQQRPQPLRAVAAQHPPQLQRAEAAPERDVPVAVVDHLAGVAWRRCAGTAGRSRACRSAACGRPPTARCSRSS